MDGGHQTFLDAETLPQQHVHQRRQAVGRAGGVGKDVVPGRVVFLVIDSHHDRDVFAFGRSGNDDLLRAGCAMAAGLFRFSEQAGGFNNEVNTQFFPG